MDSGPLDGTTNYAHGIPLFAVNVAVEDEQGVVAAATYDPMRNELFLAARGEGATLNGRPIQASGQRSLAHSFLLTDLGYQVEANLKRRMVQLQESYRAARSVRMLGSTALLLAWVACGRADGTWTEGIKPWDVAPGLLLVREAGGVVTRFDGGGDLLEGDNAVASATPELHQHILEKIGF